MFAVLTAVAVMAGLSGALAVLLVLADAVLLDYGECTVTINEQDRRSVEGGRPLLAALNEAGVFVPSSCGGRGSCGLCKVAVTAGGGPLLPTEAPHLSAQEIADRVRLACQIKVRSDIAVELPDEILSLTQFEAEVEKLADLNYDTKLVRLRLLDPSQIEFRPGQYIQLETPPYGKTAEAVYRAYSIASSPSDSGAVELVIRLVPGGICTTYVFRVLAEGDRVRLNGPYGEFYLRDTDAEIIFIAGGSGIAPIRSMLYQMAEQRIARKATFFYGANEPRDLYMVDDVQQLGQQVPALTFIPCLAKPDAAWAGEKGLVTEVIDRHVPACTTQEVYLCGGPAMIDAAVKLLTSKGLAQDRTFYDKFA
jgi:Na+-transporting NADH:ubiquinone oxidoreductase subunit F